MKTKIILLTALAALLSASTCWAATITTAGDGNWDSTTANAPWPGGTVPGPGDDVVIRPGDDITVTADATINSIAFNNTAATAATLAVNSGVVLTVTTGITARNAAGANTASTISGLGTINCASVQVGGTTVAPDLTVDGTTTLTSTISLLAIAGNLKVDGEDDGTAENNSTFNLPSGTVSVGGSVILDAQTSTSATLALDGVAPESGTLILTGATPFSTPGSGTATVDAEGSSATIVYAGADQAVLATTTPYRNLMLTGSGTKTLGANITADGTCTVSNGITLDCGVNLVSGGTFTLSAGATLVIGNTGGIASSGSTGNIRTTTRNFNAGANYTYNGTAAQVTGNGLPTALTGTLTIANGNGTGVTLSQNTAISTPGLAIVNSGARLTMGSAIVLSGTGTFTLSAGGTLAIASTAGITTGATGNIQTSTRNFDTGADYEYNGTAAQATGNGLPATVNNLTTANTAGVNVSQAVTVAGTLTLTSGAVGSAANLSMGNGATISRAAGSLTGTPGFGTSVNLIYTATVTTGTEVPASSSVLNNLTVTGGTLTLGGPVTANGSVTLTGGNLTTSGSSFALTVGGDLAVGGNTLTANASTITVGGNFTGTGVFTAGTSTLVLNGAGTQTLPTTTLGTFFNLTINKSGGTATLSGNQTVGGNLNIVAGTFSANGNTLGVTGLTTVSGGSYLASTATQTLTGGLTVSGGDFTGSSGAVSTKDVTLSNGTLTAPSVTLTVSGNWTNNGGTFTHNGSTVSFGGTNFAGAATTPFNNLTFTTAGTVSGTGSFDVAGTMTIGAGTTLSPDAAVVINSGGAAGVVTGTGRLMVTRTAATADLVSQYKFSTYTLTGLVVGYVGAGSQTVNATSTVGNYGVLTNGGSGTKTLAGAIIVNSGLSIGSGITLDVSTSDFGITVGGGWTNNGGTFAAQGGTVTFNGSGTQTIAGTAASQTFNHVVISKAGASLLNAGGSTTTLTVNNLTETTGNFTPPATLNINGNFLHSAGTFTAGANLNIGGNWTNNAAGFTPGSGTVTFNSTTAAQTLAGSLTSQTFNNLAINNTGQTLTVGGSTTNLIVSANVTLTDGTFDAGTAIGIAVTGNWSNNGGTFAPGTSVVTFNSATAQAINGTATSQTFHNLIINKGGNTLSISGSTTNLTVNNLTQTAGGFTPGALLDINGNFLHTAGAFTAGANLNIAGRWTNNAAGFVAGAGTVTFDGTAQFIAGSTTTAFSNLVVASPAVLTLAVNASATNCTVNSGATLGGTAVLIGPVTLDGTVGPGSSVGRLATGRETWNGSAAYKWEINNATGVAGTGWDLLGVTNGVNLQASTGSPFNLNLFSLSGANPGLAANFNNNATSTWTIAVTTNGTMTNFTADKFFINDAQFSNDLAGGVFSVSTNNGPTNLSLTFTANHGPLAGAAIYTRNKGTSLKIQINHLMTNSTSDIDGDTRGLVLAGTSTNGSAITTNGAFIFISPTNDLPETISYAVRDLRNYRAGDTVRMATNTITLQVATAGGLSQTPVVADGKATIGFAGIPGYQYQIQRATNLAGPWTTLLTTNAPVNGLFQYVDDPAPEPSAFYRLLHP